MSWEQWISIEGFKRTYYSVYCFFSQLCMTFDIPANITNAEPRLSLPCSEAEWRAPDPESWYIHHNSTQAPPTPSFQDALHDLFTPPPTTETVAGVRYSHFGLFVMINAICVQLWARLKLRAAEHDIKLSNIEYAIDQWQRAWGADPDCSMSPTSPHGPLSFNASAVYRMANVRLFRDYSHVKASFRFLDVERIIPVMAEEVCGSGWFRNQEMMRAVMPATLQLQIPIKMGIKLVARTAALIWSVEHVLAATESGTETTFPPVCQGSD
jgi:Fungal specific transcription factor domain